MLRPSIVWCVMTLSLVTAAPGGSAPAPYGDEPTIVVHVMNYANAPDLELGPMRSHVERMFAAAGVRVVWGENGRSMPIHSSEVTIILLTREMTTERVRDTDIHDNVLAVSARETQRSWIFYARVAAVADRSMLNRGLVLGRVMVHELGHLLLVNSAHTQVGAMRPTLNRPPTYVDRFTRAEGDSIRETLQAREAAVLPRRYTLR